MDQTTKTHTGNEGEEGNSGGFTCRVACEFFTPIKVVWHCAVPAPEVHQKPCPPMIPFMTDTTHRQRRTDELHRERPPVIFQASPGSATVGHCRVETPTGKGGQPAYG